MSVEPAPLHVLRRRVAVGESLPVLRRQVLQSTIDDYAKASGDFNPIHVDPEFARNGPFGRTIAHGLMTLSFVAQMLNDWTSGAFDECGEIDVAFIGPVFAGDTVEVSGLVEEILARDGQPVARIKLTCRVGGRDILAGSALQPFEETGKVRSMG
ncbi:MAG TPA: MaoC family dehydratase [Microvirga sp.]|nr:MaoC family dehydratase [Microvirga sp.]